eukprot:ANDGO_08128.mRNA.1 hypothetical protein
MSRSFVQKDSNGYRISYAFRELTSVPVHSDSRILHMVYAADFSHNNISQVQNLSVYTSLRELVLDSNKLTHFVELPFMPYLELLWANDNLISNLTAFIDRISKSAPSLKFFSMMKNEACPNYFVENGSPQLYREFRLFVIARLPGLLMLDDTEIADDERREAVASKNRVFQLVDADAERRRQESIRTEKDKATKVPPTPVVPRSTAVPTLAPQPPRNPRIATNIDDDGWDSESSGSSWGSSSDEDHKPLTAKQQQRRRAPQRKPRSITEEVPPLDLELPTPTPQDSESSFSSENGQQQQQQHQQEPENAKTDGLSDASFGISLPDFDPEAPIEWQLSSGVQIAAGDDGDDWTDSEDESGNKKRRRRPKKADPLVEELKRKLTSKGKSKERANPENST